MSQTANSIKIGPFGSALKKEFLTKEGYKVYGQENVYERNMIIGDRFISAEHFRKLNSCEVKPGDFLISMMGTVGKCLIVPTYIKAGIMDSHLLRLRLEPSKLKAEFLAQLFQTRIISNQVKQLSVGGIMEGLSSKIIKLLQLPVPDIEEQTAIATFLSDMDAEIAALEAKLAKARQLKQGMMQELLTGKTRLVESGKLKMESEK
jgi:type I restriction enzyme S subunit